MSHREDPPSRGDRFAIGDWGLGIRDQGLGARVKHGEARNGVEHIRIASLENVTERTYKSCLFSSIIMMVCDLFDAI
jgi:hypothetical protein